MTPSLLFVAAVLVCVVVPIASTSPLTAELLTLEDRFTMPSSTRHTGEEVKLDEVPDDMTGDLGALISPDKTGAFLTQEDVDHLTTELLRVASDLTIDLARNGTMGRNDAFMRTDVASRLTGIATVILDRARTTP